MAEVTREMILEYMQRKGGVVKNVDLVRHFRKFLQVDDPGAKGRGECVHRACLFVSAKYEKPCDFHGRAHQWYVLRWYEARERPVCLAEETFVSELIPSLALCPRCC